MLYKISLNVIIYCFNSGAILHYKERGEFFSHAQVAICRAGEGSWMTINSARCQKDQEMVWKCPPAGAG